MIRVKIIAISLAAILIVGCSSSDDELILNFRKLPLPTGEDITGIHFPDDDLGYAVTAAGSILKTVDGGETFAVLDFHAAARLEDAFFLDDDYGFVFGKDGFLAITSDGGATWQVGEHDNSYWFRDMNFLDDEHGFLVGTINSPELKMVGFIGTSIDEGLSWSFDTTEYRGLNQIDILKDNHVWISALGFILYTTDKGETWQRNATGNRRDFLRSIFFTDIQYGWSVGDDGLLLYTSDGGWSFERRDKLTERDLTCLTSPDFNIVYLAGDRFLAGSTNHGRQWEIDSLTYQVTFHDFHWGDGAIYLCGSRGTLLKLAD